jgi:hypothetical protein
MMPGNDGSTDIATLFSTREYKAGQDITIKGSGRMDFIREIIEGGK